MAWTSPRTWVVAEKITAAIMNTHVRDNLSYLKGLLDGTGGAVTVTVPAGLVINNDANFTMSLAAGTAPRWTTQSGSTFIQYNRSSNLWEWQSIGVAVLTLSGAGKMTGSGFYDSGDVSVTNGTTQSFTHGLGAQPRFFSGVHNDGGGVARKPIAHYNAGGTTVAWFNTDTTTVQIVNNSGGTRLIRTMLML